VTPKMRDNFLLCKGISKQEHMPKKTGTMDPLSFCSYTLRGDPSNVSLAGHWLCSCCVTWQDLPGYRAYVSPKKTAEDGWTQASSQKSAGQWTPNHPGSHWGGFRSTEYQVFSNEEIPSVVTSVRRVPMLFDISREVSSAQKGRC